MTIIIFLVDTSASMNQRTYLGTSLLDVGKSAVENFMKIRSRDPACRWDRYMLLTFEDLPANVKAGWKESHATFINELKNLEATGLTALGPALKNTFDLLNVNRMQTGIDTYGQGRCPFYLEPAIIICISDGRHLTSTGSIQTELNLPMMNLVPGSELTKEPFRWDQRLFGLILRLPGTPPLENQSTFIPSAEDAAIDLMCEVTGGRSYAISSQRMLMNCLESLVQKAQPGVVINFEKIGPDPPLTGNEENQDVNAQGLQNGEKPRSVTPTPSSIAWHNCRKLVYVPRSAQKGYSVGHWPIPEAFWPDLTSSSLPPRTAHPVVKFSCTNCDPMVIENLPFDKYELEPSPLTQFILERRQPNVAWQVFISSSAKYSDIGHAFGYLKASTNLTSVNLFVMPYNYPVLLPLLDDLFKLHKGKPPVKWRQQFENYLKTMPVYYAQPLKRALARMGIPNLVPDQMDTCLSYSVISYLKKLKNQAKIDYERLVSSVGQKVPIKEGIKVTARSQTSILQRKDFNQLMNLFGGDMGHLKNELQEFNTFTIAVEDKDLRPQPYKNPFDIQRKSLLDQVARMRANFLQTLSIKERLQDEEVRHNMPVQQMGNYQEYLKKQPQPLRELETAPMRQHTFGNPFKVNKNLMIDEADEAMPGQQSRKRSSSSSSIDLPPSSPGPRKRKPGPLPKDVPYRKLLTPPPSPVEHDLESIEDDEPPDMKSPDEEMGAPDYEPMDMNHTDLYHELSNHIQDLKSQDTNGDNGLSTETIANNQPVYNSKKQAQIIEQNKKLRQGIHKEIRRPGKNYQGVFSQLESVQGSLETKCIFVQNLIHEASRFKRRLLVEKLEKYEENMMKAEMKKKLSNTNQKSPSR